ncbi:MAG: hypothetical protein H7176_03020, partial [Bdellovibrionales bacterium]|nr:hypothetical protein [Massilia sp.]
LSEATGVALHGVAGCVTSVVGGSKCGPGALSAAFTKALAPTTRGLAGDDRFAGTAISSVIGGTASVLGGGKFGNGAVTGAFSYLYNELAHQTTMAQRGYPTTMWEKLQWGAEKLLGPNAMSADGCIQTGGPALCFGPAAIEGVGAKLAGTLVERTFMTSKGPVDFLAEAWVDGSKLILKDSVLYGRGTEPLTGMTREIYQGFQTLKDWAGSQGFTSLEISGVRAANSSAARPGSTWSKTFDLTK